MTYLNLRCAQVLSLATMRKARVPLLLLWENLLRKASLGAKIIKIFKYLTLLCSKKFATLCSKKFTLFFKGIDNNVIN